jgi:hypothetical protein
MQAIKGPVSITLFLKPERCGVPRLSAASQGHTIFFLGRMYVHLLWLFISQGVKYRLSPYLIRLSRLGSALPIMDFAISLWVTEW